MMFYLLAGTVGYLVLSGKLKYEKNPVNPTAVAEQDLGNAQPSQLFRYQLVQNPRVDNANQPWNSYTPDIMHGYVSDNYEGDPLNKPGSSQVVNDLTTIWDNLVSAFGGNSEKYRLVSTDSMPTEQNTSPDTEMFKNSISGVYR